MSAQILTLKLPALEAVPLAEQLPVGRLVEIARLPAAAQMTLAVSCVRQVQAQGEPVAWVQRAGGALFPPDLADSGVDLAALLVVHVPASVAEVGPSALAKAAELLLRSGAFGLVVIDLTAVAPVTADAAPQLYRASSRRPSANDARAALTLPVQSRLLGLAREHHSCVLLLSEAGGGRNSSLGPLVSLCIEPLRARVGRGAFALEPHARKDKSGSLCALALEPRRAPWGLW